MGVNAAALLQARALCQLIERAADDAHGFRLNVDDTRAIRTAAEMASVLLLEALEDLGAAAAVTAPTAPSAAVTPLRPRRKPALVDKPPPEDQPA